MMMSSFPLRISLAVLTWAIVGLTPLTAESGLELESRFQAERTYEQASELVVDLVSASSARSRVDVPIEVQYDILVVAGGEVVALETSEAWTLEAGEKHALSTVAVPQGVVGELFIPGGDQFLRGAEVLLRSGATFIDDELPEGAPRGGGFVYERYLRRLAEWLDSRGDGPSIVVVLRPADQEMAARLGADALALRGR